ncbi:MAG: methylated-DNA--[protein]-cysteine S-methyltransferase [Moraxellaceae bacterium]|nr:methylated-DNA--[protein]-cysteine S-methyltransferase [Moraxellaceae bacterium]
MNACDVVIATPFGKLGARYHGNAFRCIIYLPPDTPLVAPKDVLGKHFVTEIERYFDDPHYLPDLVLAPQGTAFQNRVWQGIAAIPSGRTRSYGDLAQELSSAARAVGQACGNNPYPIVVPCHRVVARNGLGGFAHASDGWLLDAKRWLLHHERAL